MWDDDIMAICLIRCCICSQNFQCFRNDGNSLGCQTELNKLIYRPDRYTYVCDLYVIYIYVCIYSLLACKASGEIVTKLAKIYGRKWADGQRSPGNRRRRSMSSEASANARSKIDFQTHLPPALPRWHYNSQFSLSLCLDIEQVVLGRVNWFL